MIGIIDYGMGNIFSISNACKKVGLDTILITDPNELERVDGVILPGVGAFNNAKNILEKTGLKDALIKFRESGRYMLGVCLGMQLLMTKSFEFGEFWGFNFVPGYCQ